MQRANRWQTEPYRHRDCCNPHPSDCGEGRKEMPGVRRLHSVSIAGRKTSISLEAVIWNDLKKIAHDRGQSVSQLVDNGCDNRKTFLRQSECLYLSTIELKRRSEVRTLARPVPPWLRHPLWRAIAEPFSPRRTRTSRLDTRASSMPRCRRSAMAIGCCSGLDSSPCSMSSGLTAIVNDSASSVSITGRPPNSVHCRHCLQ